jgi:hypothetical protein
MYDYKYLLTEDVDGMASATGVYSTNEIDFGRATPNVSADGNFGAHIVITQAYTAVNSGCDIHVMHSSAVNANTRLITRRLSQTQLKVLGAHYFIPIPPAHLRYVRLMYIPVSETSTLGYHVAWLGPNTDGGI